MEDVRNYLEESRAIDLFVAYRFLRILTTPWQDQEAFKLGIIDKDGKLLKKVNKLKTEQEKSSFTLLHRLIFNLKRILHKIPGVRTKIGTYATALYLLKQEYRGEIDDATIETAFTNWCIDNGYTDGDELLEAVGEDEKYLEKGKYKLKQDVFTDKSEIRGRKGDIVIAFADTPSTDQVLGQHIFKVVHKRSSQEMYVALEDLSNA